MAFESRNPATGDLLGIYPEHDKAETEVRLQRTWEGWKRWSRTSMHERAAFLARLADLLDARAETYGLLITAEMGKPLPDAIAEIRAGRPSLCRGGEAYLKSQQIPVLHGEVSLSLRRNSHGRIASQLRQRQVGRDRSHFR
jgi:acyl-CoA reductase-like NAD-dependent aldehyde dehydrogenase